jgi:para-aminobenzoate synthetase/4-amino-4-deoxychorismate lyase
VRVPLAIDLSLGAALRVLQDTERPFALVGSWAGGGALLGCDPVRTAGDDDPFELLALADSERDSECADSAGMVGGGWVGYIGYPSRMAVDRGQPSPPRTQPMPAASLAYYDNLVRLDGSGGWWFEALPSPDPATEVEQRLSWWTERLSNPPPARTASTGGWHMIPSAGAHAELVAACRERIRAGDLFQANVCAQLAGWVEGEPLELFIRGVESLAPEWAAYMETPSGTVVSLSPELFLRRRGREVLSAPIKGTRPRPADAVAAAAERSALARSDKDRAENVMIVDLIRNDLGRVCEPGTIVAEPVARVQAHAGVWHLVSEVRGALRPDVDDGQLLRATFPPGSVTGAPKIAAMDVIAELESTEREVYTGAIGIASPMLGLELNVAIRTFEIAGSSIRLGVGGGVVADSDPDGEATEIATKAAPLLDAIAAPPASLTDPRGHFIPVHRFGPFPVPRPDPRQGVFETLLVRDGAAVRLEAHLARLRSSVVELYGMELPSSLTDRINTAIASTVGSGGRPAAGPQGPMRMRIDARPGESSLTVEISAITPFELQPPARLRAWSVPGGLGRHKWIDRRLIDAMETAFPDQLPLLVDADGYVLETSRANVFVLSSRAVLRTPPDDGRLLPGVGRARVLAYAEEVGLEVSTEPLAFEQLLSADAVVLTSALRQAPVVAVDDRELSRQPELLALLEAALVARS